MRSQLQTKTTPKPSFTPVKTGILQRKCACGNSASLTRKCTECENKRLTLQRRSANRDEVSQVPPIVHEVLRSPGQPLDHDTRTFMESRFGHDFSQVRVHTDANAAESAKAVNALAYTVGKDLVFDSGEYKPGTITGKQLLAHELTHVLQQQGSLPMPVGESGISNPSDLSERIATKTATDIFSQKLPIPQSTRQVTNNVTARLPVLQRVVNERKVGCRTTGIPSLGLTGEQALEAIRQANEEAILMVRRAENNLFLERLLYGDVPSDPTFATILNEELGLDIHNPSDRQHTEIVERRFELIRARVLESDFTGHTCIGAATVSLGTGTPAACAGDCCVGPTRACSCPGVGHIVLCRPWWTSPITELRPATLAHESLHIYFPFINDGTNPKLSDAHCYTAFLARLSGITPFVSCAGR